VPPTSAGGYLALVEREVVGVGGEEEHVDEVDEDAGGHPGVGGAELDPLVEDEEDEIAEERQEENQLGQELQDQPVPLLEVPRQGDISHAQPGTARPHASGGSHQDPTHPPHPGESGPSPLSVTTGGQSSWVQPRGLTRG